MHKGLEILREIKSCSFATVNNGNPEVRIIDVMFVRDDGLYFVTARGKAFYKQILSNFKLAVIGMTKDHLAIRVKGDIKIVDRQFVDQAFKENPMMNEIYPGERRDILDAFCLYKGVGEILDLGAKKPSRERFSFGGESVNEAGYRVIDDCIACGLCKDACPEEAISEGDIYSINASKCIECGRCVSFCSSSAIKAPKPF